MQTIVNDASLEEASAPERDATDGPRSPRHGRPTATTVGEVLAWSVAALLVGAAGIHFGMMGEHAGVSWTHGVFFGVVAWVQLVLAAAVVWRRSRSVVAAVMLGNLAVLAIWLLTRTVGIAIGGDGSIEAWGTIDGVCAALEGLAIVASIGLLIPRVASRPLSTSVGFGGAAFVAVLVAALVTFVFSPATARGETASDGHDHGGAVPVSAGGPAQAAVPVGGHEHGPTTLNGKEVKGVKAQDIAAESQPDVPLDAATRAELQTQIVAARAVADRYPTVADATAGGYNVLAGGFAPGSGAHYISYTGMTLPGAFQPERPMSLIYDGTSPTSQIVGLMYFGMGEGAPEGFAGPNDHWHRHSNVCLKYGANGLEVPFPADAEVTAAQCKAAEGDLQKITGWMVHAWVVPSWESPQGVFSHDNSNVRCADNTYETDRAGFCQGT